MKRYFIIFLSLIVVIASFPVAVSADSFDPVEQDMTDLFSLQESDTRIYNTSNGSFSVTFNSDNYFLGYVEFLIFCGGDITSATIAGRSASVVSYSNDLYYRIYASPDNVFSSFELNITCSSSSSFLYILSAEFSSNNRSSYPVSCSILSDFDGVSNQYSYNSVPLPIYTVDDNYDRERFRLSFENFSNLKFYDYLNFSLFLSVNNITSISVGFSDTYEVPYTVSYIENNGLWQSGVSDSTNRSEYFVKLNIDLRDVNWSNVNSSLFVRIAGKVDDYGTSFKFAYINGIYGFIVSNEIDPVIFWFRKTYKGLEIWFSDLSDKLQDIFTGRVQDQAGADSFNDSINDQADELEDLTSDLNSVTRPPLSDVNLSTSGMVDQSVVVLATNGIGSILSNQIILRVLIMSLTFALAGFILFGKR